MSKHLKSAAATALLLACGAAGAQAAPTYTCTQPEPSWYATIPNALPWCEIWDLSNGVPPTVTPTAAPELDASTTVTGASLLLGGLLLMRGRKARG